MVTMELDCEKSDEQDDDPGRKIAAVEKFVCQQAVLGCERAENEKLKIVECTIQAE